MVRHRAGQKIELLAQFFIDTLATLARTVLGRTSVGLGRIW